MTILQNSFGVYTETGFHAAINTSYPRKVASPHAEGGPIPFGVAVAMGTADKQARLPAQGAESADLIGITVRTDAAENDVQGVPHYAENGAMSVMTFGRMYVITADGTTRDEPVYAVPGTGELVSTAAGNIPVISARFTKTAAPGEVSELAIG